ncbi:MAG: serine hydrolase [Ancalomicrobiaceae bacterium]|nr:serine hydrolase [Ancalomicrobiaceae bacterium]
MLRHGVPRLVGAAIAATAMLAAYGAPASAAASSDQTIRSVIDYYRQNPGCSRAAILVGTNISGAESIYGGGLVNFPDGHAEFAGPETTFQIGSIAKTFTATIYAQMLAEGRIAANQPVKAYLPAGTAVPSYRDPDSGETVEITIDQLARHTSGLPRQQAQAAYPYSDDRMLSSLERVTLRTRPGTKYVYSNLGTALLAKALEHVSGQSLADLVESRITRPMGLAHTRFFSENDPNLPTGIDRADRPADPVLSTWPAYEGSGGLVSSLGDMMRFLAANMNRAPKDGPVTGVLDRLQAWQSVPCATQLEGGQGCPSIDTGLAWSRLRSKVPGLSTIWKNGMTKGFSSWIGFVDAEGSPASNSGVVVLANQSSCPVGPLAACVLASINERPLAPTCLPPVKVGQ